jgi:NAD(P)-dependent dehydrogenase (short-subunit alcohol dehydrogenase family)
VGTMKDDKAEKTETTEKTGKPPRSSSGARRAEKRRERAPDIAEDEAVKIDREDEADAPEVQVEAKKGASVRAKTTPAKRPDEDREDESDAAEPAEAEQEGARPEPPLPAQHLEGTGEESQLDPRPQYLAPAYKGSGKLEGLVALITGADSGIGRAVAVLFAREGADVAIAYLEEDDDAAETKAAVEREGRRAILLRGDVTDASYCKEIVEKTVSELGKLDVLVNNAAFQKHVGTLEELSPEQWDKTFKTNIYGYFFLTQAALPHLKEGSAILNTGSITGLMGSEELLDYSSTKGAIHAFTQSLAQNLSDRKIRVNCIAPGPVWTPLNPADSPPEEVAKFGEDVPMKRPAQPEEIAPAFVFLASNICSSYISGEILPVTGGEIAK